MSHQGNVWDKEYQNPKLVTKKEEPQADTLRFFKFLKKEEKYRLEGRNVLDLGSGTGRNSNYLAERGNNIIAMEISPTAMKLAKDRAREKNLIIDYRLTDIGDYYDLESGSIDLVLDITSSNSLNEKAREVYLKEVFRVLKPEGYFFVRALAKDANKNVKNLLKQSPGKENDTYIIKEIGLIERVFSRADFMAMYGEYFKILKLEKKTAYTTFNKIVYKRDYFIAYFKKKEWR